MSCAIGYFSNGLGNLLLSLPAYQAVASMTNTGTIDICLNDGWRDSRRPAVDQLLKAWPVVNRVISWPKDNFSDHDYDLWFYTAHGSSCDVVGRFLNGMRHRPVPKPSWRSSLIHEADHYMEIAYAMGYRGPVPKVVIPVAESPILDLPRPIIGICNGWFRTERMHWEKKGWPHWKRLAEILKGYFGGTVIGIGGKGEIPSDVLLDLDLTGKLPILETAKAMSQLDLFITTDTGPMHLANIMDVPMIALFGPTLASKNAPRGRNSTVLISHEKCAPCQDMPAFYNCRKFSCMEKITVGDILAVAKEKLNERYYSGQRKDAA